MWSKKQPILLCAALLLAFILTACSYPQTDNGVSSIEDLYGAYLYVAPVSEYSLHADADEAPVFILDKDYITLFRRDFAYYSPESSNGIYHGSCSRYPTSEIVPSEDRFSVLELAGIDISSIQSCQRFIVSENILELYLVDDQIWAAQWWRSDTPYVFELALAPNFQLTTDEDTGELLLLDTDAPQTLDITNETVTREDVMEAIGTSRAEDGILVAFRQIPELTCEEYIVFEYEGDVLRSRAVYRFYEDDAQYEAEKSTAEVNYGVYNDKLHLVKTVYGYEVDLRIEYRELDYGGLKAKLEENGYQII